MLNAETLDEITRKIGKAIEASPAKDLQKNVRALLQSNLARLDVVTRDEFVVQTQLLVRTREKLEAMEARVAELEARRLKARGGD
jgi:BMFP domain-containing protein YqiC